MAARQGEIQPVVLVGGQSRRFGRDKLREPVGGGVVGAGEWLVDRPIGALRAVFGPRVALVGECDPEVARRGDLLLPDDHPGLGPAGGVLSALRRSGRDVFILAGDLSAISPGTINRILSAAAGAPEAWTVLAATPAAEPCIGLYRRPMLDVLRQRLTPADPGAAPRLSLHDATPADRLLLVPIDAREAVNVNWPADSDPAL